METEHLVLLGGALAGFVAGFAARGARFCTFGALEDVVMAGSWIRLRTWSLAIAVAIVGVQLLWSSGVSAIGQSFYLADAINPVALLIGGLMFGIGMAMVGNCAFGMIVRLGGGDLRALFVFLVMGLSSYATARGLTGVVREALFGGLWIRLGSLGGQGLGHFAALLTGIPVEQASLLSGLPIAASIAVWCFLDPAFRAARRDALAGVCIGLATVAGFWVTGGLAAQGFAPLDVRSMSYALPPGQSLIYLLTFSGATMTFSVAMIGGTLAGVWASALVSGDTRLEGYDDAREMKRHFLGGVLMGIGGVLALGCTIGQGVSGLATLSFGALIAMTGIVLGAIIGIRVLISGSIAEGLQSFVSR